MTGHRTTRSMPIGILAMLTVGVVPVHGQQPTSERRIQELVRLAAEQVAGSQPTSTTTHPQGSTAEPLPEDTRPAVSLTLDEAVRLALDRNLNIAVQRLNPPQFDQAISSLKSTYWPQVASLLGTQSTAVPPTAGTIGIPAGANAVRQGTTTFNGGYGQNLPWGGGQLTITLNNLKNTTTSTSALYNPAYLPTYSATFTQPLLRGLSIDPSRQQILVTKIGRDISDVQLKSTIINTLSSVREAYWNFLYTVQSVEIAQQAVDLASQLVRDNQVRLENGYLARLDLVTGQAQEAQARLALVQAMGTRDAAEVSLKQQIVSGTQDPTWSARTRSQRSA